MNGFFYPGKADHLEERRIDAAIARDAARGDREPTVRELVDEALGDPDARIAAALLRQDAFPPHRLWFVYGDGDADFVPPEHFPADPEQARAEFDRLLRRERVLEVAAEEFEDLRAALRSRDAERIARMLKTRR